LITAYVLIQTNVGEAGQVARAAAEIQGVQQAQPVVGPYDVIVRAQARSMTPSVDWSCRGSRSSAVLRAP
jgi:hypothetical protein